MHFVLTGPESSGKTFLTVWLSRYLQANYLPEYARYFLTYIKEGPYDSKDLIYIANKTAELQGSTALHKGYVMDTGFLVLKVWSEVRFGNCPEVIENYFKEDDAMYLLCKPDMPWVAGPLRENPDDRDELFEMYLKHLNDYHKPFRVISGSESERIKKSKEIILGYI